jgi:hypothetical protein
MPDFSDEVGRFYCICRRHEGVGGGGGGKTSKK